MDDHIGPSWLDEDMLEILQDDPFTPARDRDPVALRRRCEQVEYNRLLRESVDYDALKTQLLLKAPIPRQQWIGAKLRESSD
jgi:hypothetical protein